MAKFMRVWPSLSTVGYATIVFDIIGLTFRVVDSGGFKYLLSKPFDFKKANQVCDLKAYGKGRLKFCLVVYEGSLQYGYRVLRHWDKTTSSWTK
jgi:hypothetical protein